MHRTLDVLHRVLAHILERAGGLAFYLIPDDAGEGYAAHWGKGLESRSHVDPFAIDVVALDNDFAKIDAHAVADALGFGDLSPGFFCRILYRQRTVHGGDDAGELRQCPVAHHLEHAAAMSGDLGIENCAPVGLQPFQASPPRRSP